MYDSINQTHDSFFFLIQSQQGFFSGRAKDATVIVLIMCVRTLGGGGGLVKLLPYSHPASTPTTICQACVSDVKGDVSCVRRHVSMCSTSRLYVYVVCRVCHTCLWQCRFGCSLRCCVVSIAATEKWGVVSWTFGIRVTL